MPKRTYYDRSLGKDVRDRTVYKRPGKKPKKDKYTSKAFRAYEAYLRKKYDTTTLVFSEHMHMSMNRPGFVRRILAAQEGITLPKAEHTPKYQAYLAEKKEYSRHLAYPVPSVIYTWEQIEEMQNAMAKILTEYMNKTGELWRQRFTAGIGNTKFFSDLKVNELTVSRPVPVSMGYEVAVFPTLPHQGDLSIEAFHEAVQKKIALALGIPPSMIFNNVTSFAPPSIGEPNASTTSSSVGNNNPDTPTPGSKSTGCEG